MDSDGDPEIVIMGKFNGELSFYSNSGNPNNAYSLLPGESLLDNNGDEIDIGTTAVPFLFDIDNDFDNDLIIGDLTVKLNYTRIQELLQVTNSHYIRLF